MTSSFKKGQLVAVKEPPATKWELRVFERTACANDPYCREVIVRRPENAEGEGFSVCEQFVRPAEEIWPKIFLGWERSARKQSDHAVEMESELVQRLRKQIEWLCKQIQRIADIEELGNVCPPVGMSPYYNNCQCNCIACWEQASLNAVEENEHAWL